MRRSEERGTRSEGARRSRRAVLLALAALAVAGLAACAGPQHMLDVRGPSAARVEGLWWVMFSIASVVVVVVTAMVLIGVRRGLWRARAPDGEDRDDRGLLDGRVVVWTGGVAVPLVVVFVLVVLTARVGVAIHDPPDADPDALVIEVVGHQYWWEVRYPQLGITTANEVFIPVGEQVRFLVTSPDVIHSFWVPQLQGKVDMIPGRVNALWLRADEPGAFRGVCTEYCGHGHALMAFWLDALPRADFDAWVERRRVAYTPPADPRIAFGREVFFQAQCHQCHAVPGAPLPPTLGTVGPDLTGYGSRRTVAAGTRPNNPGTTAAWIADPHSMKPDVRMPPSRLPSEQLLALTDYLMSLR